VTLARFGGVPIHVHWTLGVLLLMWLGVAVQQGWSLWRSAVVAGVFFLSVVAHELGHVVVAKRFGVRTRRILLLPIGGAAQMERKVLTPKADLLISVGGPFVNLGLAGVMMGPALWLGDGLWFRLGVINLALGLFNLIPAFPMDGGRVLRAVLMETVGNPLATRITLGVGGVFALGFLVAGSLSLQLGLVALSCVMGAMQWQEYRVQQRLQAMQAPPQGLQGA